MPKPAPRSSTAALPPAPGLAPSVPAAPTLVVAPATPIPTPPRFQAQGAWFQATVGATGFTFTPATGSGSVAVQLVGGNPSAQVTATAATAGTSRFFWAAAVGATGTGNASFAGAEYDDVYPGIDLLYNATPNQNLEYSFVVHPGADPSAIRLGVQGSSGLSLDAQGNLLLHTPAGYVDSTAPVLFQEVNGSRVPVQGGYELLADGEVGFRVGSYDHGQLLTIDPELNDPPAVLAGGNATGVVGQPVNIESIFSDSDGPGPYDVTVDWGDGSSAQRTFAEPPLEFFTSTHTYSQEGQYTVTVTALDTSVGNSGSDTLTVTVNPPGPPITTTTAFPDDFTTDENAAADIPVLANDIAAPGTTLTVTGVTQPANGSASINGGSVHYAPASNWFGADSFTYTISDGAGGTSTAAVTVTVTWVDQAPTPQDDAATTTENTPVTLNLVANDTAPNPDTFANGSLWVSDITEPQYGTVAYNGDGTVTYTPNGQFNSAAADGNLTIVDQFTYTLSTWAGASATATVRITVTPVNDPPIAYNDYYALPVDVASTAGSVLANDFDPDWRDANYNPSNLRVSSVNTAGTVGTVTMNAANGMFTYQPPPGFVGWTTFQYTITDGTLVSAPATVYLYVQQPGAPPCSGEAPCPPPPPPVTAQSDQYLTNDSGVSGNVLANDTNATLAILVSPPTQGILTSFSSGGSFTYLPEVNVTQEENIAYLAVGNQGQVAQANLRVDRPRPWFNSMTHNFKAPLPYPGNIPLLVPFTQKPGGYVHYNEDDDNRATLLGFPIADKDKTGPVANEKDLVPFEVKVSNVPDTGTVTLERSNTKIRVWRTSNKGAGNEVLVNNDSKTWDLANATERADFQALWVGGLNQAHLWVEGYEVGASTLTLTYKDVGGAAIASDTLNWNVFGATAGRQPTPAEHDFFLARWPKLVDNEWSITDEPTPLPRQPGYNPARFYNCIAWSVGETNKFYLDLRTHPVFPNMVGIDQAYGNDNGIFELKEDLKKFYATKGYEEMAKVGQDDRPDVMYYSGYHAAAKKDALLAPGIPLSQLYESKLGVVFRIEHVWNQLDGSTILAGDGASYGERVRFYKRLPNP